MTSGNGAPGQPGGGLIFGRYTREECGLPPGRLKVRGEGVTALRVAVLLLAMLVLCWLAGTAMARWREGELALLPARIAAAPQDKVSTLMNRARILGSALPDNRRIRRSVGLACLAAAERTPRRLGYYANAAGLFRGLPAGTSAPGGESFATWLTASGAYAETGDFPAAFAALDAADAALADIADEQQRRSYRLILINSRAYYLATADRDRGGDPEAALRLARLMISSRDELPGGGYASGSAALLDTLATAWAGNGDPDAAAATQSLALGLADAPGLEVYLRHYDEFAKGKNNGK